MVALKEVLIYVSEFLISLSFTILASFYPGIAEEKGIPIWLIGVIFSIDPIVGLPVSIWTGQNMNRYGRKKLLVTGLLFNSLGTLLIGMLDFTENSSAIIVSVCSRVLAGLGAGLSMTTSSAILIIEFPENIDRVIGYFEAASGLGLLLGPIVGSLLYLYRLSVTFSGLSVFLIVFTLAVQKFLATKNVSEPSMSSLPMKNLIIKPRLLVDFGAQMWLLLSLGYLSTVIELHLLDYGLSQSLVGLVYTICLFFYFITSILENHFLRWFSGRLIIFIGILCTSIGFLFIGDVFPLAEKNIYIVSIGLGLVGFGGALMYIPTTSNILNNAIYYYNFEDDEQLVDCISSCTIFVSNIGEIAGPIIAGLLTQYFGFSFGFCVMALSSFVFLLVYLFTALKTKRRIVCNSHVKSAMIYQKSLVR